MGEAEGWFPALCIDPTPSASAALNDKPESSKLPKRAICKWSKDALAAHLGDLLAEAHAARYVCRKCGRTAARKSLLCKPEKPNKQD